MSIFRRTSGNDPGSGITVEGNEIQGDVVAGNKTENHYHLPQKKSKLVVGEAGSPEIQLPNDSRLEEKLVVKAKFDKGFLGYARRLRLRAYKKTIEIESLQKGHLIIEKLKDEVEALYYDCCHGPILDGEVGRRVYSRLRPHLTELVDRFPFEEFEGLHFDDDYLRGLIFETTAECRLRWERCDDDEQ